MALGSLVLAPSALAVDTSSTLTIEQARERFDALYREAEQARDRLEAAAQEAESITARLDVAAASVQRLENRVTTMTAELGGFAAAMYRAPVPDPTIALLVDDDPEQVLAQSSRVAVVAEQRVQALVEVAEARTRLERDRDDLAEQQSRLDALERQMRREQRRLDAAADEARTVVQRLEAEERQRLAGLQRQTRLDAQARASRSEVRESLQPAVSTGAAPVVGGGAPGGSGCVVGDPTGTGGCVTPVMAWVVQQMRATFGSMPMACWRGGGGDHAQGRACDIMFAPGGSYASGEQQARGWQLAEWLRANAGRLQVDYVIWQGRIWSGQRSGEGWRPYNGYGATGGHYDHVHVSVLR